MALSQLIMVVLALNFIALPLARCDIHEPDENYNRKFRPNAGGPPVNVHLGVYVESLGAIKETTMDFQLTMYFRESWFDPRLAFNGSVERIYVGSSSDAFWSPDIFFLFEKNARKHDVTLPNVVFKIQPDGSVFRSSRISVTTACYMDLQRFPFDSQKCTLNAMSYSYSTKDLTLQLDDSDVSVESGLTIPSFTLEKINTENENLEYSTAGNYSLSRVVFTFQRQMQSFLLTVYIPSVLLVTVAWLSFCIDAQAAPARVSLGITTVLTITTMTSGIQESLPVVTYAKAIDVWLAACLVFVFSALIEYALANYLLILQKRRAESLANNPPIDLEQGDKRYSPPSSKVDLTDERLSRYQTQYYPVSQRGSAPSGPGQGSEQCPQATAVRSEWTSDRVDRVARYTYPACFIIFNLIYWPLFIFMKPADLV